MAVLPLSAPPELGSHTKYSDYKPWLLESFYYSLCSYCLLHNPDVQVEHYEPVSYAPDRQHDPTNLLLACPTCNGNGGKGDYHPQHSMRRRKPDDHSGHLVADVRSDNFGDLFRIDQATGAIGIVPGPRGARAAWNIALLKLDLPHRDEARRQLCDAVESCRKLIAALEGTNTDPVRLAMQAALTHLLAWLRKQRLFFIVHEIALPPAVAAAVESAG